MLHLLCSAGPETQAMTHTDGGVKCSVQVSLVANNCVQNAWLIKVRWEPAEGAQLEPSFQVTITRFVHQQPTSSVVISKVIGLDDDDMITISVELTTRLRYSYWN